MIASLLDVLFGCCHKRYSFPITVKSSHRRNEAASVTGTYVVCLDCGKEFPYDWREMRVVSRTHQGAGHAGEAAEALAAKQTAA
ncbi:MAG TPA: hypothetical protein VFU76_17905 [Terriglobales bacterium]|nr:hypothetical protein [Terriglobales bacterium]